MKTWAKKVSIIIPTCKSTNLIPCLESIKKYTDLSDKEIIICANGYDGERGDFEGFNLIWHDERIGYTKAINEGIKQAKGEYIVLLNDDTVFLPQEIDTCINVLLEPFKDEKIGITGPMKTYCPHSQRDFLIFFCVAIPRKILEEFVIYDEI